MILLNLIRIIYSHLIFRKTSNSYNIVDKVIRTHTTYWLTDEEICLWVESQKDKHSGWNKYQMWREVKYHNVLYKYGIFKSHTDYADFEDKQSPKTFLRRFLGNILY